MALGRKGLTSGAIKGLNVCCVFFSLCAVSVLSTVSTLLSMAAVQSHTKQCAGADEGEICIAYIQFSPPIGSTRTITRRDPV
ncbi:unnamed protein product, partial [Staurois parvus]